MWNHATVNAYDVMGSVHITAVVRSIPAEGETGQPVELHSTTTVDGAGQQDCREWLEDVLVALLETL